jgi:hypothetical protein
MASLNVYNELTAAARRFPALAHLPKAFTEAKNNTNPQRIVKAHELFDRAEKTPGLNDDIQQLLGKCKLALKDLSLTT